VDVHIEPFCTLAVTYTRLTAYPTATREKFGKLTTPDDSLACRFQKWKNIFANMYFPLNSILPQVGMNLKSRIENIVYFNPCPDFPLTYLIIH
jgi:hypothetical protein